MSSELEIGSTVYIKVDYRLLAGQVVSKGRTKYKIKYTYPFCEPTTTTRLPEDIYLPDDQIVFVWEQWKGRNGRGGYRVEKDSSTYPDKLKKAKDVRLPADMVYESYQQQVATASK